MKINLKTSVTGAFLEQAFLEIFKFSRFSSLAKDFEGKMTGSDSLNRPDWTQKQFDKNEKIFTYPKFLNFQKIFLK